MAVINCMPATSLSLLHLCPGKFHGTRCLSTKQRTTANTNNGDDRDTPQLIRIAVSGVTELLRLFSPLKNEKYSLNGVTHDEKDGLSVSSIEDVIEVLKDDYEKAYFVTGVFTSGIYADNCIFEDPTIKFRGKKLYARNLKLLVPFFDSPSIGLQNIEKGGDSEKNIILATWKLRTYLRLPWRPLISIDGNTIYELDDNFDIVRHAESWSVSALQAIIQIFIPSQATPGN